MQATPRFSKRQAEDLGDARLVLDSAAHNTRAAIRGEDSLQALDNAIAQAEQALETLRRIRAEVG
jgi:hypothetical protein